MPTPNIFKPISFPCVIFFIVFVLLSWTVYEPTEAAPVSFPWVARARHAINIGREIWGREGNKRVLCNVFTKLSWNAIYCAIPRTEPNYQSGSLYCRRLGIWDPWIIWEYNIATTTKILTLTQPYTCKMGSSIFTDMSRIVSLITTMASFLSMPSTKRKIETFFHCSWQFLPCLSFFYLSYQDRSVTIVSLLWVSQFGSPSLM